MIETECGEVWPLPMREPTWLRVLLVPAVILMFWYLTGVLLIWYPSLVYRIEEPVQVIAVHDSGVQLQLTRWARMPMRATCARQIVCENVVTLASDMCPVVAAGWSTQRKQFPIPAHAFNGFQQVDCFYQGTVSLEPLSTWGPVIHVSWRSEIFTADRPPNE